MPSPSSSKEFQFDFEQPFTRRVCVSLRCTLELAHFINYSTHPGETRRAYSINKLQFLPESLGVIRALEAWYTGVIIIVCMVFMYSAAQVTPPFNSIRLFLAGCFLALGSGLGLVGTASSRR